MNKIYEFRVYKKSLFLCKPNMLIIFDSKEKYDEYINILFFSK